MGRRAAGDNVLGVEASRQVLHAIGRAMALAITQGEKDVVDGLLVAARGCKLSSESMEALRAIRRELERPR